MIEVFSGLVHIHITRVQRARIQFGLISGPVISSN
jgi:hypothetical protein